MTHRSVGNRLRDTSDAIKREWRVYDAVRRNPRTPRAAKWLLGIAIAYLLSLIDLIPDFIPVIGHLDDALIVPGLVVIAVRLIPAEALEDARAAQT